MAINVDVASSVLGMTEVLMAASVASTPVLAVLEGLLGVAVGLELKAVGLAVVAGENAVELEGWASDRGVSLLLVELGALLGDVLSELEVVI